MKEKRENNEDDGEQLLVFLARHWWMIAMYLCSCLSPIFKLPSLSNETQSHYPTQQLLRGVVKVSGRQPLINQSNTFILTIVFFRIWSVRRWYEEVERKRRRDEEKQ